VKPPLHGRVALVTGGAVRVGASIARALAEAGASVAVHVRSSRREGAALARSLRGRGRKSAVLEADLADPVACAGLVPDCVEALGRLDVLVNNAGAFEPTDPSSADAAAFDRLMAVNARAPYVLSAEAGRWMKAHGGGAIVNVACASVFSPWPGYLPYSASKAALASLTVGFAKALAPRVRVNAVAPGPILPAEGAPASRGRKAVAATLLKRWGDPKDVAAAVVYLATAPFVTGTILPVDGGRHVK
jgi:pteridine reductase